MVVEFITNIVEVRHPSYLSSLLDWRKWRITYNGGEYFRKLYLKKFSVREDDQEFNNRLEMPGWPSTMSAMPSSSGSRTRAGAMAAVRISERSMAWTWASISAATP